MVEAPVTGADIGEVGDVERHVVVDLVHRQVLEERDDVVHVLLVDLADLQLGDEGVDRGDGVLVDIEPPADVDVVVHAHHVEEDVDVVDQGGSTGWRARRGRGRGGAARAAAARRRRAPAAAFSASALMNCIWPESVAWLT